MANGDVLQIVAGHQAFAASPGGGGSISATDGTVTVDPATSIRFPAGTLASPGGGVAAVTLIPTLLIFTVNFDDVGITDYTRILWTPAAGDVIVDLWCVPIVQFAGADVATLYVGGDQNFDGLIQGVTGGTTPDLIGIAPASPTADFGLQNVQFSNWTLDARMSHIFMTADGSPPVARSIVGLPAVVAANGTNVVIALNVTNGPLTAGQLTVYAIVATPAS